jgi:hypothetical protein
MDMLYVKSIVTDCIARGGNLCGHSVSGNGTIRRFHKPAFDIMLGGHVTNMNNSLVYTFFFYMYIYKHTPSPTNMDVERLSKWKIDVRYWCESCRLQSVTFHQSVSSSVTTCKRIYTVP